MPFNRRLATRVATFGLLLATGCNVANTAMTFAPIRALTRGPVPVGPGAATTSDLSPWLDDAPDVSCIGRLDHFLVYGQSGVYPTWSLVPTGRWVGSEVDVRACGADCHQMFGRIVRIDGKLIERGDRHLPLLVAKSITPHGDAPHVPSTPAQIASAPRP